MANPGEALPLSGLKALDCTQWNSGPMAMRICGDLGADVIKIESIQHPDPLRMSGVVTGEARASAPPQFYEQSGEWNYVNRNKRGLTLNLTTEAGADIFKRLVKGTDILAENLRPGVWEGFGLGYDILKAINPRLIFVQMPGYGTTGPWRDHPYWALAGDQMSGFSSYTGYPGGTPLSHALWADYANGTHLGFVLLAALWHRRKSGLGQFIDLSQLEVITALNPEALLDYQFNGRIWEPRGNLGRLGMSPHGCFPCEENHWIAIAVGDDAEWQALCFVIGDPELREDSRYGTAEGRLQHQTPLHESIAAWTQGKDKWELMHRLQKAGVPAAAVAYGYELHQDPHLWERGSLERVERRVVGEQTYVGSPFRYSKTPIRTRQPAPTLGQHNHEILADLGFSSEEIEALEASHVIGTAPLH